MSKGWNEVVVIFDYKEREYWWTHWQTSGWQRRKARCESYCKGCKGIWQDPGVGDELGGLVCCSPWGHKVLDMTKRLNWTDLMDIFGGGWVYLWHRRILLCYGKGLRALNPTHTVSFNREMAKPSHTVKPKSHRAQIAVILENAEARRVD